MAFKNLKKITIIEISTLLVALLAVMIYFSPNLINKKEVMKAAKIKANNSVFVSKALEEFASNASAKPSDVAKKISDELNIAGKNPYDKNSPLFTFEKTCFGCNSVEYDDNLTMIILTTYDKKGELVARTVIKPPSFVVYSKDEEKNKGVIKKLFDFN